MPILLFATAGRLPLRFTAALLGSCLPLLGASLPPSPAALQAQAQRCRQMLLTNIVDFYLPACLDSAHGGYLETLQNNRFVPNGTKFLTLQARQLWFFSTLAQADIRRDQALRAARSGFDFIEQHMRDPIHGGYFSKVSDAGDPQDTRKHVYLNAFALYGLTAYYQAAGHPPALQAAQDLFQLLEAKAHDRVHGGYTEFFQADWQRITNPDEPGYVGAIGTKTYNTHLHLMEAFTALCRPWPNPLLQARLQELIHINTLTVHHPRFNCNLDGWHPDWKPVLTPQNLRASYGHDIECAWLTLDAARTLQLSPALFRGWAENLCAYSLEYGYDSAHGGFYYTGPLGQPAQDRKKEWWPQAEALVSMLEMYRLTRQEHYYEIFAQTLEFIASHQMASGGGWWASRTAAGEPLNATRSSPWQGAYHNGRALLLAAQILQELAQASDKGSPAAAR